MVITLPRILEKDIIEFCKINNITDINHFMLTCFRNGYSIAKFGLSPKDNVQKQNKPLEIEDINDEKTEEKHHLEGNKKQGEDSNKGKRTKQEKELEQDKETETTVIKKPKRNIRIIKK